MKELSMDLPHLIGICGNPNAGKSTTQQILWEDFSVHPVDDGKVLRDFAEEKLGLSYNDVYTQEGKARYTEILGKTWQHRDILGTLGKHLEDMFGPHIMPFIASKGLDPMLSYSFGSVRKTQGHFIKKQNGVVLGVRNPLFGPSAYAFDKFDEDAVHIWIENDGISRGLSVSDAMADLRTKIHSAVALL